MNIIRFTCFLAVIIYYSHATTEFTMDEGDQQSRSYSANIYLFEKVLFDLKQKHRLFSSDRNHNKAYEKWCNDSIENGYHAYWQYLCNINTNYNKNMLIETTPLDQNIRQSVSNLNEELFNSLMTENLQQKRDVEYFNGMELLNDSNLGSNRSDFNQSKEIFLKYVKNYIYPKASTWVIIIIHSIVFVIGLIGNTLVCIAVYRNRTMKTVTNYFIVNLAVADFMVILICLPPTVVWDVTFTWFFGIALCKIIVYLQTVSITVSVLTLTFISIDRWYAICLPLRFRSTTGRAKTAICIIWFIAFIYDIPELVVYNTVPNKKAMNTIYFTQCDPSWSTKVDIWWMIAKAIILYAFPLIFMTIAYYHIVKVLWKSGNVHQHSLDIYGGRQINTFTMNTNTSTEGQLQSRRKAAKMLVAVVIMFAVCNFPVHLAAVMRATLQVNNTDLNQLYFQVAHWLCYANSAVNPIIYNFMSGKFRKEFRRAFEHCCQSTTTSRRHYQLSNLCHRSAENGSGLSSKSQSRSSKRTLTEVRRLDTIERGFVPIPTAKAPNEVPIDSKIEV